MKWRMESTSGLVPGKTLSSINTLLAWEQTLYAVSAE